MMPPKKIKLHVHSNNAVNGVLNVKVTPWRVHLDAGDVVEWELDATGPNKNDILWFRVEQTDPIHPWPFNVAPPDAIYTAAKPGKVTTPARNNINTVETVISYGLTIAFQDDEGRQRITYIDPDMIIDT
jgi:hypothetical protein